LIYNNTSIPHNEFITAVSLILNTTVFKFNNNYYKQIFGTPMDSPILADMVLQDLEKEAIKRFTL